MGRRGENIRKRKDGRWEARIIYRYTPDGRGKYHSIYGKTYQEVKEKRSQALKDMDGPVCMPAANQEKYKILFSQIMEEWLESKKDSVKESTLAHYSALLKMHILPELGDYPLSGITSEVIDVFLRTKLRSGRLDGKGGLSNKTVADIRSVILLGLEYARQRQYPCGVTTKLFYPRNHQPYIKVLTREEQEKLEKTLFRRPEPVALGILLALYGGLRIGEVCALQWNDFDFESNTVSISKTMIRIQNLAPDSAAKTRILIDSPKTESSKRLIPLPAFLMEVLKAHRRDGKAYLLTGEKKYMEPRICLDKYKKILVQAGLEDYTFHTLRHTFATRCVESGFDSKSLSEILGHSNVNTTLQRYVHPSLDLKREQMERLKQFSVKGQNPGQEIGQKG